MCTYCDSISQALYSTEMTLVFGIAEELSDMRKQMKAMEEKNVTYMRETMNLQEVRQ